jgi:hypothetical protein
VELVLLKWKLGVVEWRPAANDTTAAAAAADTDTDTEPSLG